jgi:glycosyltransferase involved in cell wall biosynthesis
VTPSFSIITACKGRLDHLRRTLPRMLGQAGAEVIVVEYSCPEGTADVVEREFPQAKVIRVEGEKGFSNWRARNLGAAAASGNVLIFCDADTILAEGAVEKLAKSMPAKSFGFFTRHSTEKFNRSGSRLAKNQMRGFHVIPAAAFKALDGYDEVAGGYAAGGDTDLEERLMRRGFKGRQLGDGIVEDVIEHAPETRFTYHADPIAVSYAAGQLYRRAKLALMSITRKPNLPLKTRQDLYRAARTAAANIAKGKNVASMNVTFEKRPIGMPRQLGFEEGHHSASIVVRIDMSKKIDRPPE